MLIRFSVANFKSFKDQTSLYMVAGRTTRHSGHLVEINGQRILKGSYLFGANASGKSNLIEAVAFARDIVANGLEEADCDGKYFRIDDQYKTSPGVFQFDFLSNNRFYSYGFAISYDSATVVEEWLYETGSEETCIFLRQKAENGQSYRMESEFGESIANERFHVYMSDFRSMKLSRVLFLSDVSSRAPDDDIAFRAFKDTSQWFSKLSIISPAAAIRNAPRLVCGKGMDWTGLLDCFDTGIDGVSIRNIKDRSLLGGRIAIDHGNPNDLFSFRDESEGTKRLFELIPIYYVCRKGAVVFVDEIDRSLHPNLTNEFIKHYYQMSDGIPCQLIATAHDSSLINLDVLRQDEIWFVDRKPDHSSTLFSLNRYKIRSEWSLEEDYLIGRYGGVPVFSPIPQIEPDQDEEDAGRGLAA